MSVAESTIKFDIGHDIYRRYKDEFDDYFKCYDHCKEILNDHNENNYKKCIDSCLSLIDKNQADANIAVETNINSNINPVLTQKGIEINEGSDVFEFNIKAHTDVTLNNSLSTEIDNSMLSGNNLNLFIALGCLVLLMMICFCCKCHKKIFNCFRRKKTRTDNINDTKCIEIPTINE